MQWMRRARTRRATAGLALALTVLHVAFLSLHVAMMAALAFSGNANAAQSRIGFVLCAPSAIGDATALPGDSSGETDGDTATFCPVCTGATSPALILPELPALPTYVALAGPAPTAETPAPALTRPEAQPRQSRAPPHLT